MNKAQTNGDAPFNWCSAYYTNGVLGSKCWTNAYYNSGFFSSTWKPCRPSVGWQEGTDAPVSTMNGWYSALGLSPCGDPCDAVETGGVD
jgi:hypothetical protein